MPPSRPSVDLIADEAAAREEAALDAYDSLASKAFVGLDELSEALMQLARETEKVPSSSRAQETRKAQTDDFLRSRGHRDRPASFEQFIEIYNDFVDFSVHRKICKPRFVPRMATKTEERPFAHRVNARPGKTWK